MEEEDGGGRDAADAVVEVGRTGERKGTSEKVRGWVPRGTYMSEGRPSRREWLASRICWPEL